MAKPCQCPPPPQLDGIDFTARVGARVVVNMQQEPQRSAFNAYRVAHRANAAEPNLNNAAALVEAWNCFAEIMGLEQL